jgi:outer membrane receptor protein involved in Fe transport
MTRRITIRRTAVRFVAIVVTALAVAPAAHAQSKSLQELSIEDLLRVEVQRVFGASERLQPVTEAPSSVTIVTSDEIALYGFRTLADLLRSVRGFYVTNDRNYSYVGVRGFGRAGDYNTRVLLLVNGHRVNDNVFDQAAVGYDFGIDARLFERVEVIRGPSSSLYGTSAFFAVVNVITRSGDSINGGMVEAAAGSLGERLTRIAIGRHLDNGVNVAVSGSYRQDDGMKRLFFPAFDQPTTNGGVAEGLDAEQVGSFYGQFAFRNLTITAADGERAKDVPTASFGSIFNLQDPRERTVDRRSFVTAEYVRALRDTRLSLRASYDRYAYRGYYPLENEGGTAAVLLDADGALGVRWGVDGRVTRALPGRQTLTAGAEFVDNVHQNQWESYSDPAAEGFSLQQSSVQSAAFIQDEVKLRRWLLFDGGVRFDHYNDFHRLSPRAAVIVVPSVNQSFKYLFGRAFRAPNVYELYYFRTTPPGLRPESIDTHEIVWEQYTASWLRTSASAYTHKTTNLISLAVVNPDSIFGTYGFVNDGTATARGLEFEAEVRTPRGMQLVGSYALQRATDQATGLSLSNSPEHLAKLRVSVPLPVRNAFASIDLQHLSNRTALAGTTVPGATIANVLYRQQLTRSLQVVASARNLFDRRYADPASDEHLQDAIEQNGRTLQVRLSWSWWKR